METIGIKQSLISTINGIDDRNTDLLEKLVTAVKSIMKQDSAKQTKDEITPFVNSMKIGMKLPDDFDLKAARDEHLKEKSVKFRVIRV